MLVNSVVLLSVVLRCHDNLLRNTHCVVHEKIDYSEDRRALFVPLPPAHAAAISLYEQISTTNRSQAGVIPPWSRVCTLCFLKIKTSNSGYL